MTDPWDMPSTGYNSYAEAEARTNEARRQAVAELLVARGHDRAAALVAISGFQHVQEDQYEYRTYLSVPAAQYDLVDDNAKRVIDEAARAVVGTEDYQGLVVDVRLGDASEGWDRDLLERLHDDNPVRLISPIELPAAGA